MSATNRFDPASIHAFRVADRSFDVNSRTLSLGYAFDGVDGTEQQFCETITFETPASQAIDAEADGFQRALLHLHIAAGVSYYKAAAPPRVQVEGAALDAGELLFHRHIYDDGLREFAVSNGLSVPRTVAIDAGLGSRPRPPVVRSDRTGGLLVPIGGGKDSMVLIEATKALRPTLFAVNPHPLVRELADLTGLDLIVVRRQLSPRLGELNRSGGLNGHVPITAIISLIAVVGSFLYGYDAIAMAVERSASEETVMVNGVPVNHQYSKSLEFEALFRELVATSIDPGITYASALRPFSELAIARVFSGLTKYHRSFCSCNTVFRQTAPRDAGWCGNCPKCRFVGLMLAPFVTRSALSDIIGRDMFSDPAQIEGFAALMSDDDKPFECVGERRESAAAFRLLAELPEWRSTPVVAALSDAARSHVPETELTRLMSPESALAYPRRDVAEQVAQLLSLSL